MLKSNRERLLLAGRFRAHDSSLSSNIENDTGVLVLVACDVDAVISWSTWEMEASAEDMATLRDILEPFNWRQMTASKSRVPYATPWTWASLLGDTR